MPSFRVKRKVSSRSLESRFTVSDGDAELVVEYSGILPDLFRENQAVIATGAIELDGVSFSYAAHAPMLPAHWFAPATATADAATAAA